MGPKEIHAVLSGFPVPSQPSGIEPLDSGYINRSFAISYDGKPIYVLQQLNTHVFPDIGSLMDNLRLVLPYLQAEDYTGPELISTNEGSPYFKSASGAYWRLMTYVTDSYSRLFCSGEHMASEAGRILGVFHRLLNEANPADFKEFLPDFQSLAMR
ncbi:MAG: aminoglycoside phosphotransferase family protein, partial [Eudoraea sp.]|nr:aminoglycoside phosphotransferase family protein [Eudoraea sp.]